MTTKRKKKYYIKKGPVCILVLIIAVIVISIVLIKRKTDNQDESNTTSGVTIKSSEVSDTDISKTESTENTDTGTNQQTEESTEQTSKDEEAIDAFKSLSFYKDNLKDRYIAYKNSNSNLSYEQAVLYVNIGLDNAFYTNINSISDPSSVTAIVNKYNSLGNYEPSDLVKLSSASSTKELYMRKEAAKSFENMCSDAAGEGMTIKAMSTYRSYARQTELYNAYVQADGKAEADTYSARAGHSEHQTGLVADVQGGTTSYTQFKTTKESSWVNENSYKYGFIVRYPEGKEDITGYMAEAWHLRYVGVDVATVIHNEGITFDEYYAKYLNK